MLAPRAGVFLVPVAALLALDLLALFAGLPPPRLVEVGFAVGLAGILVFLLIFFRDPSRSVGEGIVSAADGRIRAVEAVGDRWLVSVFMNVTDVHVNRFPLDATVETIVPSGHGFRPAYRSDAGRNVRQRYTLRTAIGPVDVVQITGAVARRLVPFARTGETYRKGDRLGMIVLGSRVDVLLPAAATEVTVRPGDRVRAGSTTIARVRP